MQRIFLFVVTNLAVLSLLGLVLFIVERGFGVSLGQGGAGNLLVFAALVGCGGSLSSLVLSKWTAKRLMRVRVIDPPRSDAEAWLVATVGRLAAAAGIRTPEVGIFETEAMNAFATGARRDAALVAVSSGLLRSMPRPQVEAVLGHEITHVANGDMVTLALLQGVLNTFVIFLARPVGSIVDRVLFRNDRGEPGLGLFLATLAAQFALGVGAGLIVCAYSRRREFRADRGGATLAGAGRMIAALELLKSSDGESLPAAMQALSIQPGGAARVGGAGLVGGSGRWMQWFRSHPPLDARIEALRAPAA